MNFILKNKLAIIGVLAGAIGGYLYYFQIGCASGTCPITSKPLNSTLYGAVMGGLFLSMFKQENNMTAEKIIKEKQGTIVDVRTSEEYSGGHVVGSVNIPLQEIAERIDEVKALKQPLVLCCASGNRSGQATNYLSQQGIECVNGGSWFDVNYYQSQTV